VINYNLFDGFSGIDSVKSHQKNIYPVIPQVGKRHTVDKPCLTVLQVISQVVQFVVFLYVFSVFSGISARGIYYKLTDFARFCTFLCVLLNLRRRCSLLC